MINMNKQFSPICYHLPDLDVTTIDTWNGIPFAAMTAMDLVLNFPNMFWFEADNAGKKHLCCATIAGTEYPEITTSVGTIKPVDFVHVVELVKTEGDRVWHPTTKPPRPIL